MKYIIKNCDNCYYYDDEENIKDQYWCEFERDNTHFAKPCYKSDCLLKQIVEICKYKPSERIFNGAENIEIGYEMAQMAYANKILDLLEIEECEDE